MPAFRPGNALFVHFLQGGGATFWQAKNGGFWGPAGRRARRTFRRVKGESRLPHAAPTRQMQTIKIFFIFIFALFS
jgi:hypothetical protein